MKIIFIFCSILLLRSAIVLSENLIGVAPTGLFSTPIIDQLNELLFFFHSNLILFCWTDKEYYSSGTIKCKDGSKSFTKSQLNDDFCDCSDGTDEPGFTSFFSVNYHIFVMFYFLLCIKMPDIRYYLLRVQKKKLTVGVLYWSIMFIYIELAFVMFG